MVIQANMSPKGIIDVWPETKDVFDRHNISISNKALENILEGTVLTTIIEELNSVVGSSAITCTEGG